MRLNLLTTWSRCFNCIGLLAALVLAGELHAAGVLSNPGFESDAPGQHQNLLGWTWYGQPWGNTFNETGADARSGNNFFKVFQGFTGSVNYNGVYQDYISGPGATYTADGWAFTATADALDGQNLAWIEVSFRDATGGMLSLYRSALITTNTIATGAFPKSLWNNLRVTNQCNTSTFAITNTVTKLVAPVGTFYVRYQLVFQGDANNSGGSVYFDDLNLAQISGTAYGDYNIVWSDEFDGTAIKTNLWTYDTGTGGSNPGWGNNELENYTSRATNAFVTNGLLHIVARKESLGGASYTSARMKSQGLFAAKFGRIEWRAALPTGVGFWPALWLLGTNITTLGWPGCGEVDVLENVGSNPLMAQASIHSGSDATAIYNFTDGNTTTNFHTYTFDWTTNAMLFYVDGHLYQTQTSWGTSVGGQSYPFPFNQPFFFIMNLAIGGNYIGNPTTSAINAGSVFPGEIQVDYLRIYNVTAPFRIGVNKSGANLLLTWPSNIVCRMQSQTNLLVSNWVQIGTASNSLPVAAPAGNVFYRLVSP